MQSGVAQALLAATLFGASTPLAKLLTIQVPPALLAGLLYAGSGVGLGLLLAWRHLRGHQGQDAQVSASRSDSLARLTGAERGWLAAAILAGGVAGPLLLMLGLRAMPASGAALLLNLEGVLTALLAWFVFHENFDRRILLGMAAITVAGLLLAWQPGAGLSLAPGAAAIAGACLCWAVDNNLTRKIAAADALQIAACKGIVAGIVNLTLAVLMGATWPSTGVVVATGVLGFCGYGLSLVLFVLALRQLGSARTGAYFSVAPFAGAAIAILLLHEATSTLFWVAALLMAIGLWLHLSERHAHAHVHEPLLHTHAHTHAAAGEPPGDLHHLHTHDFAWSGSGSHVHAHQHDAIAHSHAHYPDIHHRHRH